MAITIQGDGDVFKVTIPDRGPARVTVKVAPTKGKEEGAVWKSTFIDLTVWGGTDRDGNCTPGAELVHDLQQKDKIRFEAKGKTDTWRDKEGKDSSSLAWTVTRLELVSRADDPRSPKSNPDDIPF